MIMKRLFYLVAIVVIFHFVALGLCYTVSVNPRDVLVILDALVFFGLGIFRLLQDEF